MTAEELARAVTEPARLAGLKLEPGLVELILRDVAAEPGALPLLSHALRATWERRDGRTLTVEGYRESGGVASAIARTADAVVDALPDGQRRLARSVFLRMTELGEGIEDTRRRVAIDELVPEGAAAGHRRRAARAARRRAAGHARRRHRRGRARGADPRVAAAAPLARRGPRGHPRAPAARRRRAALGRGRPRAVRPLSRRAARRRARPRLARRAQRDRARLPRRERRRGRARAARRAAGQPPAPRPAGGRDRPARGGDRAGGAEPRLAQTVRARPQSAAERAGADVGRRAASARWRRPRRRSTSRCCTPSRRSSSRTASQTRGDLLAVLQQEPGGDPHPAAVGHAASRRSRSARTGGCWRAGTTRGSCASPTCGRGSRVGAPVQARREPIAPQAMRFSPDGRTLAVGTRQGDRSELYLVDVARRGQRRIGSWRGLGGQRPSPTTSLAYAPDGRRLAVGLATMSPTNLTTRRRAAPARSTPAAGARVAAPLPAQPRADGRRTSLFRSDGALITSAQQGETLVWDARGRPDRAPLPDRRPVRSLARRAAARAGPQQPYPGDPSSAVACSTCAPGASASWPRPAEAWIMSLAFTRDGSGSSGGRATAPRLGRRVRGDARDRTGPSAARPWAGARARPPRVLVLDGRQRRPSQRLGHRVATRRLGRRSLGSRRAELRAPNPCAVVDPRRRR